MNVYFLIYPIPVFGLNGLLFSYEPNVSSSLVFEISFSFTFIYFHYVHQGFFFDLFEEDVYLDHVDSVPHVRSIHFFVDSSTCTNSHVNRPVSPVVVFSYCSTGFFRPNDLVCINQPNPCGQYEPSYL